MSNQVIPKEIQKIPVSDLKFDPENPRIPSDIDGSNDDEVIDYLLTDANLDDLMKSLLSQGYFEGEPLLVCPSNMDGYIVVEGNRRLGALKLINGFTPSRKQGTVKAIREESSLKITEVPCIVFKQRDDILGYLGYRHITGIKEWNHLAKARYLNQLYEKTVSEPEYKDSNPKDIYKVLAKNIGSRSNAVENLLRGLEAINFADDKDILSKIGIDPNKIHFSLLTTALTNPDIKNYVYLNEGESDNASNLNKISIENLLSWLYGGKDQRKVISESRDIQKLAKIISNEDSLKFLIEHQEDKNVMETAYTLAGGMLEGFEEGINKVYNMLSSLQELVPLISDDISQSHIDNLDNIHRKAKSLHGSVKVFLESED